MGTLGGASRHWSPFSAQVRAWNQRGRERRWGASQVCRPSASRGRSGMGGSVQAVGGADRAAGCAECPCVPFSVPSLPLVAWFARLGGCDRTPDTRRKARALAGRLVHSIPLAAFRSRWAALGSPVRTTFGNTALPERRSLLPAWSASGAEAPGAAALESARESDVEADSREGGRAHERN